jgi:UDP-N-acetylmuramoyl-tripeptide--D-alanyl-D-alanine ligase
MRAALDALAAVAPGRPAGGRAIAVLGHMAELGPDAPAEHEAVGRTLARLGIARLIAVGEQARPLLRGTALEGCWTGEATWVPDADAAIALLRAELRPADVVLVKASRAARLERVAQAVTDDAEPDEDGSDRT